jgi:RimJ/RimL family protein N-acetyltransferase
MTAAAAELRLRSLRKGERRPVEDVFAGLGERSRRLRFLGPKPRLTKIELERLVDVDSPIHRAVVAIERASGESIGIARYVRDADDPQTAEVAFAVVDAHQGRGVGSSLATALADVARRDGVRRLRAAIAPGNGAAVALVRRLGDPLEWRREAGLIEVTIAL